ncbi:MAG TPA: PAS domain S-box protein, partial [Pyrinomonadaceae bacterium]|nr:PAS domain S-box protein [Pyrinomonadaceae bacterium]
MRDRQHERNSARPENKRTANRRRNVREPAPVKTDRAVFAACFEHAAIGLSVTDLEGRVLEANAAYCSITGYSESELRTHVDLQTLIHPHDLPIVLEKLQALVAGEIPAFVFEHRYVRKDTSIEWVRNSVSIVPGQSGHTATIAWLTQ